MKLLVMCATHKRPKRILDMISSFYSTKSSSKTRLIIYISEDDPFFKDYKKATRMCEHVVGPHRNMVEAINYMATVLYPDIEYYQEINDDHVYRTNGWDKLLVDAIEKKGNGWGFSCARHYNWPEESFYTTLEEHPSAVMVSGNIVRTLGYFLYPEFTHIGCDDYVRDLAKGINRLFYVPEVEIEHVHFLDGRVSMDDGCYREIYSQSSVSQGMSEYSKWKMIKYKSTITKLLHKIERENCND